MQRIKIVDRRFRPYRSLAASLAEVELDGYSPAQEARETSVTANRPGLHPPLTTYTDTDRATGDGEPPP